MSKFDKLKKGDKVRVILGNGGKPTHKFGIGEIVVTDYVVTDKEETYGMFWDEDKTDYWFLKEDEVELIEEKQLLCNVYKGKKDPSNPDHYKKGEIECWDAIGSAVVSKSGIEAYYVGNVIKYLWRYEDKNGVIDIDKAIVYLNKLRDELNKG